MKLPKDDISLLFSAPRGPLERSADEELVAAKAPVPAGVPSSEPASAALAPGPHAVKSSTTNNFRAAGVLKRAAPAMWRKLDPNKYSRRELRTRMQDMLAWLAERNQFSQAVHTALPYTGARGKVDGRLFALWSPAQRDLSPSALELCFDVDEAVLSKLSAAHLQGWVPVFLWAGTSLSRPELLTRLQKARPDPAGYAWLITVSLNG